MTQTVRPDGNPPLAPVGRKLVPLLEQIVQVTEGLAQGRKGGHVDGHTPPHQSRDPNTPISKQTQKYACVAGSFQSNM